MVLDHKFSDNTKKLIAESRLVAIDLGYNYISTLHFLLADCRLNHKNSIRKFLFSTDAEFETFFWQQKVNDTTIFDETLPLTIEAEETIHKGCSLWNSSKYYDKEIQPYHFFLAASRLPKTVFYSVFLEKENLYAMLESYYVEIGQIDRNNISTSLWSWLSKKLFSR